MSSAAPTPGGAALAALPQTPLVREAFSVVGAVAEPSILAHSVRAYLMGRAFGGRRGLDFDDEGLALAAIFHDLGLDPAFRKDDVAFPIASSRALGAFLRERGVAEGRIRPLVDAIDFHMQLLPRWSKGNVAGLMQVGAWMDATGLRRGAIAGEAKSIEERFPRNGFKQVFNRRLFGTLTSVSACLGLLAPERYR